MDDTTDGLGHPPGDGRSGLRGELLMEDGSGQRPEAFADRARSAEWRWPHDLEECGDGRVGIAECAGELCASGSSHVVRLRREGSDAVGQCVIGCHRLDEQLSHGARWG